MPGRIQEIPEWRVCLLILRIQQTHTHSRPDLCCICPSPAHHPQGMLGHRDQFLIAIIQVQVFSIEHCLFWWSLVPDLQIDSNTNKLSLLWFRLHLQYLSLTKSWKSLFFRRIFWCRWSWSALWGKLLTWWLCPLEFALVGCSGEHPANTEIPGPLLWRQRVSTSCPTPWSWPGDSKGGWMAQVLAPVTQTETRRSWA